jgi:hypothetical protein
MPDAQDIHGTVFKNGSAVFLARVVDADGAPVVRAAIASVRCSVYLLDDQDPDVQLPIAGHGDVALAVTDVLHDALQTGGGWTRDALGYNFRHVLDVSAHPAFAVAGRNYRVEYLLAPPTGQVVRLRFRVHAI